MGGANFEKPLGVSNWISALKWLVATRVEVGRTITLLISALDVNLLFLLSVPPVTSFERTTVTLLLFLVQMTKIETSGYREGTLEESGVAIAGVHLTVVAPSGHLSGLVKTAITRAANELTATIPTKRRC
jgi:hypothetical protein